MTTSTKDFESTSQFFSTNIVFISELYQKFVQNPSSVDSSWAEFFVANEDDIKSVLIDYQGPSWGKKDIKLMQCEPDVHSWHLNAKPSINKS